MFAFRAGEKSNLTHFFVLCFIGILWPVVSVAEQLPVYKLAEPKIDQARAASILANLHKNRLPPGTKSEEKPNILIQRAGDKELEIYKASGGVFLRDTKQLWNQKLKPRLPSRDKAKTLADEFLASSKLLPSTDSHIKVSFSEFTETGVATDRPGKIDKKILDIQVNYKVDVVVEGAKGEVILIPVVGGGGNFKVALGHQGEVIGYQGVWRPIAEVASMEEILPRAEAEAKFKSMAGNAKVTKVESFLAYYSAPAFEEQRVLAPVWVIKAEAQFIDQKVPLRNTIIAATKYGPIWPEIQVKPRVKEEKPRPESIDKDEKKSWLDLIINTAYAGIKEAGTSWIGPSQGLGGSPANAQGFVDGLAAAGWTINFNWGETAAFESDWNSDDDNWADAADFVFYTGHANSDGWVLNNPNDTFLHHTEVGATPGSPNDRYGQNDLEWIIIAACGPHQSSHFVGGVGNAFDRWRGIFDGLHVFLGYGAVTFDNTTEGSRVVELARAGWPIIDAWFRTAWEIQPSSNGYGAPNGPTIYVTAMYAHDGSHNTRNDHIWGTGTTVSDPVNPGQQRYLMWSGT